VDQGQLHNALQALAAIPEVANVGTAGPTDLLIQAVARDSEDFYRIGQLIPACPNPTNRGDRSPARKLT
jgi:Lrp/AsnC ligand binding domain